MKKDRGHYLTTWWNCPAGMVVRVAITRGDQIQYWADWPLGHSHLYPLPEPLNWKTARRLLRQEKARKWAQNHELEVATLERLKELGAAQALARTD